MEKMFDKMIAMMKVMVEMYENSGKKPEFKDDKDYGYGAAIEAALQIPNLWRSEKSELLNAIKTDKDSDYYRAVISIIEHSSNGFDAAMLIKKLKI